MQLLALAVQAVTPNGAIDLRAVFVVKVLTKITKIVVRFANVPKISCYEFNNNDIIEIADDRNIVGQNIFGITEVDEHREQAFTIGRRKLPFVVGQHLNQCLELRNTLCDEIRQRFIIANFIENVADRVDNFLLFRVANRFARLMESLTKILQIAITEFK